MDEILEDCKEIENKFNNLFNKILTLYPDGNPFLRDFLLEKLPSLYSNILHKMYQDLRNEVITEANKEIQSLGVSYELSSVERKNNMFKLTYYYVDKDNKVHEFTRGLSCR